MVPLRTHILTFMNFRPDHGIQCTVQLLLLGQSEELEIKIEYQHLILHCIS